jgi:thioredoxin-dependent peroxiredoxin
MIKKGQLAPIKIEVLDETGQPVSLSSILGKPTIIYFYPRDNTPGCTKEACSFRDYNQELVKMGVQVIGISGDSVESHNKFKEKHQLNFPLWSDPERKLIKAFGVLKEKTMFGKKFQGIVRSTFLLDKTGKVLYVWPKVKADGHAQEILNFILENL